MSARLNCHCAHSTCERAEVRSFRGDENQNPVSPEEAEVKA